MVGDWMGSQYGVGGDRWDLLLFLDHDGRYERTDRFESSPGRTTTGRWEFDESERVLRLHPDTDTDPGQTASSWSVSAIAGCEDSNVLLVLRQVLLGSRNLPFVLYRVHRNGRAYGTDWQKRLSE